MSDTRLYLRANVMAEPLIDAWYAHALLIPPATLARNLTERMLRMMDSFIASPESHRAALRNPALIGGPFMDLAADRMPEVQALRDRTLRRQSQLIELSGAIATLDTMLKQETQGYALEPLYDKVPACLRGYVELVYDLNERASFRLIEPLLYKSRLYDETLQRTQLSVVRDDARPFVFSTPRLDKGDSVELEMPFASERYDMLFRLREQPATLGRIRDLLELNDAEAGRFAAFLTPEAPRPRSGYAGPGMRWRYLGHACVLLETRDVSILLDPVLSYAYPSDLPRYTYEDLPERIDFVLITHGHQDHLLFETLLQLRHRIGTIVVPPASGGMLQDPSLRLVLKACGFRHIVELPELEEITLTDGSITAVPFVGEHADLNILTKTGYLVRLHGHKLLFVADSCSVEPEFHAHIHQAIGNVDTLFVGMECDGAPLSWIYGPLLTQRFDRKKDHSRRLAGSDSQRALGMAERFRCEQVYVYAMGQEPWLSHVMGLKYTDDSKQIIESNLLVETCRSRGIVSERLFGQKEIILSQD
jgi:L-ascorbate metabolism protein UlaG (beta-lactamase superfamily)